MVAKKMMPRGDLESGRTFHEIGLAIAFDPLYPILPEVGCGILAGRHILVAEDMAVQAMEMKQALDDLGCIVVGPAASLSAALALLNGQRIDAVITGYHLADDSSSDLIAELQTRRIPFLVMCRPLRSVRCATSKQTSAKRAGGACRGTARGPLTARSGQDGPVGVWGRSADPAQARSCHVLLTV
jgi:CheY-like chemotaxis protein